MRNALVRFGRAGMRNALVRFGKRAALDDIPLIPDYAEAKRNGAPQPFGKIIYHFLKMFLFILLF